MFWPLWFAAWLSFSSTHASVLQHAPQKTHKLHYKPALLSSRGPSCCIPCVPPATAWPCTGLRRKNTRGSATLPSSTFAPCACLPIPALPPPWRSSSARRRPTSRATGGAPLCWPSRGRCAAAAVVPLASTQAASCWARGLSALRAASTASRGGRGVAVALLLCRRARLLRACQCCRHTRASHGRTCQLSQVLCWCVLCRGLTSPLVAVPGPCPPASSSTGGGPQGHPALPAGGRGAAARCASQAGRRGRAGRGAGGNHARASRRVPPLPASRGSPCSLVARHARALLSQPIGEHRRRCMRQHLRPCAPVPRRAGLGVKLVVVIGARPQINAAMRERGVEPRYEHGYRVTDAESMQASVPAPLEQHPLPGPLPRPCSGGLAARPVLFLPNTAGLHVAMESSGGCGLGGPADGPVRLWPLQAAIRAAGYARMEVESRLSKASGCWRAAVPNTRRGRTALTCHSWSVLLLLRGPCPASSFKRTGKSASPCHVIAPM